VIAEAGRRDVRLSVRVDNVVARRLYESLGFGVADRSSQPDRLELAHVSTEACG
jgi:ribosomal protein S18 acetylase RimI-like enzyme